jgi:hypothetical protein
MGRPATYEIDGIVITELFMALCQDPEVSYLNGLGYNVGAEPAATLNPL